MGRAAFDGTIDRLRRLQSADLDIGSHGSGSRTKTQKSRANLRQHRFGRLKVSIEIDGVQLGAVTLEPGLGGFHVRAQFMA